MHLPRFLIPVVICSLINSFALPQERQDSAWEVMLEREPEIVDDSSFSWVDRLALHVLSVEQAKAYLAGARPKNLVLSDGQTLADYLEKRLSPPASVYIPLPVACPLFDLPLLEAGESWSIRTRENLLDQGGSEFGCSIPEDVTALLLRIQAETYSGEIPRVKLWASDSPEPAESILEVGGTLSEIEETTAIVNLCRDCEEGGGSAPQLTREQPLRTGARLFPGTEQRGHTWKRHPLQH